MSMLIMSCSDVLQTCTHRHAHRHAHMHTHAYTHTHTHMLAHMHICTRTLTHTCRDDDRQGRSVEHTCCAVGAQLDYGAMEDAHFG